jgi:hypothetical protein
MSIERRKAPGAAWNTVDATSAQTFDPISVELTTDPDTFIVESEVYDLGNVVNTATMSAELVSFVEDGETVGHAMGEGNIDPNYIFLTSADGVHFGTVVTTFIADAFPPNVDPADDAYLTTPGDPAEVSRLVLRYFRFHLNIDTVDDGELYAGTNHPTVTVLFGLRPLP